MADTKISALPAATTPLAGTEVLPIVQGGTTDKVSIANVTAGREVSMSKLLVDSSGAVAGRISRAGGIVGNSCIEYFNGTQTWNVGVSGSNFFGVNYNNSAIDSALLRVSTAGDVTVSSGNIIPSTAAKGINYTANTPAAGMSSQLLNWYEEGTWTPTDNSGAGLSITNNSARYTRVGRQVSLVASITYPVTANGSNAQIGGFPFSSGATPIPCNIGYATVALTLMSYMNGAGTAASFFTPGANVSNATMSGATVIFTATYFV